MAILYPSWLLQLAYCFFNINDYSMSKQFIRVIKYYYIVYLCIQATKPYYSVPISGVLLEYYNILLHLIQTHKYKLYRLIGINVCEVKTKAKEHNNIYNHKYYLLRAGRKQPIPNDNIKQNRLNRGRAK